ncbi:hypothetical protein [Streptomyces sp. NPDC049887]|uniref:hypothetical protein n=1 Tax=unclassified Streptomyces TaxID=2593676 RepID=UPI0034364F82
MLTTDGSYFVGRRPHDGGVDLDGDGVTFEATGPYVWQNISDGAPNTGFPEDPCSVSITAQGNSAYAKVLTLDNEVWETHGDIQGGTFVWDEPWVELTEP